jgi:hypothetical protein
LRVRLETSGGYAGLQRTADLDTDDLSSVDLAAALNALQEAAAVPPAAPGPQPRYRLTVFRPGGPLIAELSEPDVPAEVRPLLRELLASARPAG